MKPPSVLQRVHLKILSQKSVIFTFGLLVPGSAFARQVWLARWM
jgi:hypothetical protein